MKRNYVREDDDVEGLTPEQRRDFASRGGWMLLYVVLVAIGVGLFAVLSR